MALSEGVGGGTNRSPRITYANDLFAVAWESHPSQESFATVVDASGGVAPLLRLWSGRDSSAPLVIAAPQHRFVATFSVANDRLLAAALQCRPSAPAGAPQRIAP